MTIGLVRPLGIGICAPYDLSRDGGVNSHIRAQARALRAAGHDVVVFGASSAPLGGGEVSLGRCISVVTGGTETAFGVDPRARRRAIGLLRTHRFDVIHMHEPLMPLAPWFVLRHSSAPVVATFHVHREQGHRWYPRYRWILGPLMQRIRVRLAVSDAARRTVARHFPGHYDIVPNGIDVGRFERPAAIPEAMRGVARYVLFVGRLEPRKGVDALIRAMAGVRERVAGATLVVVGDGPDRAALEAAASAGGVPVSFVGRVSDDDLPAYYRAADVVCSPARGGESFGIVLLEAMAAGRPVVATRIEGYTELLADADCGRLVEPGDPGQLAGTIAALLEDRDACQTLGRRGAAFARRYDWTAIAGRLESVYSSVAASGQNEYGRAGLNSSDASDRFERPFTR
jgi:phosphatidylinositol alpha-mannosyltransferase